MTNTIERTDLITREDFYEMAAENLSHNEFIRLFGCEPLDIFDFDYDFSKVKWNQALEFAYQECLDS